MTTQTPEDRAWKLFRECLDRADIPAKRALAIVSALAAEIRDAEKATVIRCEDAIASTDDGSPSIVRALAAVRKAGLS
jgi:hypothetical protein